MEMGKYIEDKAKLMRESRQLRRLEILMDVVYAIVIWRIFTILPRPDKGVWTWDTFGSFLSTNILDVLIVIIGLIIVTIYWLQNNALFGNLERTDNWHTAISILQIFFLLLFLYSIRLGVLLGAGVAARLLESITAALVGIASVLGWSYAIKDRRLLAPEVSQEEARQLQERILVEPTTAIITIPCAFIGPILWEISWFLYPLLVALVKRRKKTVK
jgi:uncharacterized membrane protein